MPDRKNGMSVFRKTCCKQRKTRTFGLSQFAHAGNNGGSGGHNIVDNEHMKPCNKLRTNKVENLFHIILTLQTAEFRLTAGKRGTYKCFVYNG